MKQQWQLLLAISLSGLVSGCNLFSEQKQVQQDQTILEVGDQQVSVSEFEYVYEKNNSQDSAFYTKSSLRDYLDLYTEFKLKVEAAREAGLDTLPKLQREFSTYQDQLAEPYLQNDSVMSRKRSLPAALTAGQSPPHLDPGSARSAGCRHGSSVSPAPEDPEKSQAGHRFRKPGAGVPGTGQCRQLGLLFGV